jgi:hypothetical protein
MRGAIRRGVFIALLETRVVTDWPEEELVAQNESVRKAMGGVRNDMQTLRSTHSAIIFKTFVTHTVICFIVGVLAFLTIEYSGLY